MKFCILFLHSKTHIYCYLYIRFTHQIRLILFKLTSSLSNLIKSERVTVTATNTETATLTLENTPTLILGVYCDGSAPIVIDRIGVPVGKDIALHFSATMSADSRFRVIYI